MPGRAALQKTAKPHTNACRELRAAPRARSHIMGSMHKTGIYREYTHTFQIQDEWYYSGAGVLIQLQNCCCGGCISYFCSFLQPGRHHHTCSCDPFGCNHPASPPNQGHPEKEPGSVGSQHSAAMQALQAAVRLRAGREQGCPELEDEDHQEGGL